ncbi:MAG: arginine deiminase [Alphaproteobacteria bacterium]|nr:arginine deiminase [Alphaproteobacteria bacterium]MCB9794823.1 arginine deiminase [Alphaproteobacteria bacterium]
MVYVGSEVARLRRVVVQRPGPAHAAMLPGDIDPASAGYLLFDDLIHVPDAQAEHDQLSAVLSTSAEVARFDDMLSEVLSQESARAWLVEEIGRLEGLGGADARRLGELTPAELERTLVTGSLPGATGRLFAPLPNLLFARDLAAVVGETLVVGNASKRARKRESLLTWVVVEHHPWFAGARVSENSQWVRKSGGSYPLTIEGGDVLVISDSLALIGASERTSWSMIIELARELTERGFSRVLVVEMPKQRSSMHLDTVFTLVDWDAATVYTPILEPGGREECRVIRLRRAGDHLAAESVEGNLLDALAAEGHPLRCIPCGGGDPQAMRREQWTDGANHVALSPGVVLGYARNEATGQAMAEHGFEVVHTERFLDIFERDFQGDYSALETSGRRFAVQITGSELSRGRGGPRCLTFPVERR